MKNVRNPLYECKFTTAGEMCRTRSTNEHEPISTLLIQTNIEGIFVQLAYKIPYDFWPDFTRYFLKAKKPKIYLTDK